MSFHPTPLLRLFVLLLTLCAALGASAANGLPATMVGYAGSFELSDAGVPERCTNPNQLSGSCACPASTQSAYALRVIHPVGTAGTAHGGLLQICSAGSPTASGEFAGAYQQDDDVPGGMACRTPNALTHTCACPTDSVAISARVLVDTAKGLIGSNIYSCLRAQLPAVAYAGGYQLDDPVAGGMSCRHANPATQACSCPAGFNAQAHRVLVDGGKGYLGSTLYSCVAAVSPVHLCPGILSDVSADLAYPNGAVSAHAAVQNCLNALPVGGVLELPAGSYRMDKQLQMVGPKTLRTQGAASGNCLGAQPCATFVASADLYQSGGLLAANATSNVTFEHIVLDGNRMARLASEAYKGCKAGQNGWGFNARAANCTACSFNYSASINALCGTGFEWRGDYATITHSIFAANGNHFDSRAWSDGLTLLQSSNAQVTDNQFVDNSDVGFIFGGGRNAIVKNNVVRQQAMTAYAGAMLDNFNGGTSGDFAGTVFSENKVQCDHDKCLYAMNLGPHAWYQSTNISGGSVLNNVISGGVIALNVDGAGTDAAPMYILGNTLASEKSPNMPDTPACKNLQSGNLSVSSDTRLRAGSSKPDVAQTVHGCVGRTQW